MGAPAPQYWVQGESAVSADWLNTPPQTVYNLAQLASFIGRDTMTALCLGTLVPNDGGQGFFYWLATYSVALNGPGDGVNTVVPVGVAFGAWIRIAIGLDVTAVTIIGNVSPVTLTSAQSWVGVENTTGALFNINLPAAPITGENHTIKDLSGNAATFPIVISGNGKQIDGGSTYPISSNYGSSNFKYTGTAWAAW